MMSFKCGKFTENFLESSLLIYKVDWLQVFLAHSIGETRTHFLFRDFAVKLIMDSSCMSKAAFFFIGAVIF